MSSRTPDEYAGATGAKEIRAQAGAWLERREFESWHAADQVEFDAWLKASPANVVAYLRVSEIWERADRLRALRRPMRENKSASKGYRGRAILPKAAAAMMVAGIFGYAATIYLVGDNTKTYATPVGASEIISFADGSKIELNTDTVLRARVGTKERWTELVRGEAYFQIKHDAAHPFVVVAAGHRVTDLGTKFLVRDDRGPLEVALMEGSARIESVSPNVQPHSAVLLPGDVALATSGSMSVSRKSDEGLAIESAWRHGLLVFNHTTLADVAAEFNRYNTQKLSISDPSIARRTIGGTFPTNGVEEFAEVAKGVFGLRVKKDGDEIVISR